MLFAKKPGRQTALEVKRTGFVDFGNEGTVLDVRATVRFGGRSREIPLVEKIFLHPPLLAGNPFSNPELQFATMGELIRLNRERKLGLSLVPTIRLIEDNGRNGFLLTKLKGVIPWKSLGTEERRQFTDDMFRQADILTQNGFVAGWDAFFAVKNNGHVIAVLGDFGTVLKKRE